MLQRILVGLDGSALAESILPFVTMLAQAFGASVKFVHVLHLADDLPEGDVFPTRQDLLRQAGAQALAYLNEVKDRVAGTQLTVETAVLVGDAATEVVDLARRDHTDLIALATHGRSGIRRLLYGSVAEKVMHTTGTPVLLLLPHEGAGAVPRKLTYLLVPLDGSPLAESVLPHVEMLALRLNVPVVLLRVVEIPMYAVGEPTAASIIASPELIDALTEEAAGYLDGIASRLQSKGIRVTNCAPLGIPAAQIERQAVDSPGALIVIATHGRTGLAGALLGSVARQVLKADCPTIMVPPPAAPSAVS